MGLQSCTTVMIYGICMPAESQQTPSSKISAAATPKNAILMLPGIACMIPSNVPIVCEFPRPLTPFPQSFQKPHKRENHPCTCFFIVLLLLVFFLFRICTFRYPLPSYAWAGVGPSSLCGSCHRVSCTPRDIGRRRKRTRRTRRRQR